MLRWVRLVSLFLLAVWLPATQHCALEAAGLIEQTCRDDGGAARQDCASDGCASLESARYHANAAVLQVLPPTVLLVTCGPWLARLDLEPVLRVDPVASSPERPRDWVATWHFVRRTAPPSRAPTVSLA